MTPTANRRSMYIKQTDLQIMDWLAQFRLLQPRHIHHLSGRHIVAIRRRLRQLTAAGFIDRLTLPWTRLRPIASPPDEFVYRLGRKGTELVSDSIGSNVPFTPEKKTTFLDHDLTISAFHVVLHLVMHAAGLELQWRQDELQDWVTDDCGERLSVNPDSLFALTDTALPVERNTHCFFLEVERVRQHSYRNGQSAFTRKVQAYLAYAAKGVHRQSWGMDDFRVLTITPTQQRVANLRGKLVDAGIASDRFWFTDSSRYSLDRPSSVLEPIWNSPGDDRCHRLME